MGLFWLNLPVVQNPWETRPAFVNFSLLQSAPVGEIFSFPKEKENFLLQFQKICAIIGTVDFCISEYQ